jgi:predicted metalloprotease with PDZ domain
MTKLYNELLGVASHELFHAWNIKTIRPKQMFPYNYYTENYSELGFIYEGFTTYYGDKLLWQSGVFNDDEFFNCINERLNRHFINYGKFSQSLLNSSIDTWVDGYANHAPHKKVSIYDEGCLLAMMMDLYIIFKTKKKKSLRDVCLKLYDNQINNNEPYTLQSFIKYFLEFTKDETDIAFFDNTLLFPNDYIPLFEKIIKNFGLYIEYKESENWWERYFGFKASEQQGKYIVNHILPESPAYYALSLNDEILAVNSITSKDAFTDKSINKINTINLTVQRFHKIINVEIKALKNKTFYQKLSLRLKDKLSTIEKDLFSHFKKM